MYPFPKLQPRLSAHLFAELCAGLPAPVDATQAARDARDMAAMAALAALDAADAAEAMLAMQIVAAEAHGRDCLRRSMLYPDDQGLAMQFRARATALMRTAQAGVRVLQQLQATRPVAMPEPEIEVAAPEADPPAETGYSLATEPAPPGRTPPVHPDQRAKVDRKAVSAFQLQQAERLGLPSFASAWVQVRGPDGRIIRDDISLYDTTRHGRSGSGFGRGAAEGRG